MQTPLSRRLFLAKFAGACTSVAVLTSPRSRPAAEAAEAGLGFAPVDFHVHLDNSTLDKVLELSEQRRIQFGIVEHAGTKENKYPVILSSDQELERHINSLEGKPVFKGIQAEWIDWMSCFSPQTLGRLDYVLSDAMTFPGPDGRRMKLWERGADVGDPQRFMDRYVDWHVEIMAKEPLDILANTSWLPDALLPKYDALWTTERIKKVANAAVQYGVALEISASYKLPKLHFLELAKAAGVKFSFGSNGRYPKMGLLDYSVQMAKALDLRAGDMFTPAPPGQKPFQRRSLRPS
jgi:histidinol phosphatase-like PHP family hydrolase